MILATTAGQVGSEAAPLLARRGERVRVLASAPSSAGPRARTHLEQYATDYAQAFS